MQRIKTIPRPDWEAKAEALGFDFHTIGGDTYWDESAYYTFSAAEIDQIESATNELWEMCLKAVDYVIDKNLFYRFHIPEWFVPHLIRSWEEDDPAIYGRFDFAFRDGQLKLLEFNADTPTSLFEASIAQWFWLEDRFPNQDQFNALHEKLVAYWAYLKPFLHQEKLHFTCVRDSKEDFTTTAYLRDCAMQAGLETNFLYLDEIAWDEANETFLDTDNQVIRNIFKLYPYEWMVHEAFGKNIMADRAEAFWIEPSWKMLLSNKAILPILWELFPYHKNLLKCYFDAPKDLVSWCEKPILSREGANVKLVKNGQIIASTDGEYGEEGFIYQDLFELPEFEGNYALVGSWVIGQEAAGIGIREAASKITDNGSRFVPHRIV
jgi:glutathionylspermidine synthase